MKIKINEHENSMNAAAPVSKHLTLSLSPRAVVKGRSPPSRSRAWWWRLRPCPACRTPRACLRQTPRCWPGCLRTPAHTYRQTLLSISQVWIRLVEWEVEVGGACQSSSAGCICKYMQQSGKALTPCRICGAARSCNMLHSNAHGQPQHRPPLETGARKPTFQSVASGATERGQVRLEGRL